MSLVRDYAGNISKKVWTKRFGCFPTDVLPYEMVTKFANSAMLASMIASAKS